VEGEAVTTLDQGKMPQHPAVVAQLEARHKNLQVRLADAITAFAGSMKFVYIHAIVFAVWMIFLEKDPWPKLTLVVSLEAIFLSTFVMIGQNRSAAFQQAKANHDFVEQEQELKTNTTLTREIEVLTKEIHQRVLGDLTTNPATGDRQ
jgi:uncharacterized membrane protein